MATKKTKTYPENIYVQHQDEIIEISKNGGGTCVYPTDVCMDIFDNRYGLKHDDLARAQYFAHFGQPMSKAYEKLLKESEVDK